MAILLPPQTIATRDKKGIVRRISHVQFPYKPPHFVAASPLSLANWYIQNTESLYGLDQSWPISRSDAGDDAESASETNRLEPIDVKTAKDVTVVTYSQSYAGLPVFDAGLAVRVSSDLSSVISLQSSLYNDIDIDPKHIEAFKTQSGKFSKTQLQKMLGLANKAAHLKIEKTQLTIYCYKSELRFDAAENEKDQPPSSPKLKLPKIPCSIVSGKYYVVRDVLFEFELPDWGVLEWRALIELETNAVLNIRAGVESCTGAIFRDDPITISGNVANTACAPSASLDPLMDVVDLQGLNPQNPQALSGQYVQVIDTDNPNIAPPTTPQPACEFIFSANTDNFAAVNAYHHMDALYRMVDEMGFVNYFGGTTFPIPMDHRGESGAVNAHHHGSGSATTKYRFGLSSAGCAVGIACDRRIVIHEFGHSVLRNHIDSGVYPFAHGVGDTMAVILSDPNSSVPDRFDTFPFTDISRRHDRDVASGWGWGGTFDTGSYSSTQILSTTMFRAYRSLGGDASEVAEREFAARFVTYLILAAVQLETPLSKPAGPEDFSDDVIEADLTTTTFDGHTGGSFHKVIRWAFEKQDAYGGQPPEVDVYIEDGRSGEYPWLDDFTNTTDIWTRYEPDGGTVHQNPLVGTPMYVYVRVRNRGTQAATNVTVKAFRGPTGSNALWPDQFTPLSTPELTVAGTILPGDSEVVGPIEWTPPTTKGASIIMSTSTPHDTSNIDTISQSVETRRFVPYDNNIAQQDFKVSPYPVQYGVKFVCGSSGGCGCSDGGPVAPGSYFTAINIYNPTDETIKFRKKIAIALPGERSGHVSEFTFTSLASGSALEIDCADIFKMAGLHEGCFLKGFLVIQSLAELDVVAVYSAAGADKHVETLEIEYVTPRINKPDDTPPPEKKLPDLVPLPAFPPPSPNAPGQLPQNFCFSTTGENLADAIRIKVRNQGIGDAPESITKVEFGNNPPIQIETPAIAAGVEVFVETMIPRGCFVGESGCGFKITVDATSAIEESNETNNTVSGGCPGIAS